MQTRCCLASLKVGKPFARWTGAGAGSYVFSIYGPDEIPAYPDAVYIVVRNFSGTATPVLVAATCALPALLFHSGRYNSALRYGGNEVHVHVPAAGSCPQTVAQELSVVLFAESKGSAAINPKFAPGFVH